MLAFLIGKDLAKTFDVVLYYEYYIIMLKGGLRLRERRITYFYPKTLNPCNFIPLLLIHILKEYNLTIINNTEI